MAERFGLQQWKQQTPKEKHGFAGDEITYVPTIKWGCNSYEKGRWDNYMYIYIYVCPMAASIEMVIIINIS